MMEKEGPFDEHYQRYEEWFERNQYAYQSELKAVRSMIPEGAGIEVGVGSGRFAEPLSVKYGLDPSVNMLKLARQRGIEVIKGIGEKLPFKNNYFDYVLIVTTICFFDDAKTALREVKRILKDGGKVIIGFIDRESELGKVYLEKKESNPFYREANFFSYKEVMEILTKLGFSNIESVQTIFNNTNSIKEINEVKEGYGEGSFVVVRGIT